MSGARGGKMTGNDARRLLTASVPDGLRFVPVIIDRRQAVIPLETLMNIRRSLENKEHPNTVLETPSRIKKKQAPRYHLFWQSEADRAAHSASFTLSK